tara:strand:+ start:120 stop:740 length:621 start_codon:yes stop_codon:yes gene_type:complete
MVDYYKLYNYCKTTYEAKKKKRDQFLKNREARVKKELFNTIINEAYDKIKENAEEGFDYAVIYDSEHNKLVYELMDSLIYHFKPFNVLYKKKTETQRGFLEIVKDESNYILIVDWKSKNLGDVPLNNIIHNSISELPTKCDTSTNTNTNEKTETKTQTENIETADINIQTEESVSEIINETIDKTIKNIEHEEENIIKKLGFEPLF